MKLVLASFSLALGVAVAANVYFVWLGLGFFVLGACLWRFRFGWREAMILTCFFVLGFSRYAWAVSAFEVTPLLAHHSEFQVVQLEGVIVDYPDAREDRLRLTIKVDRVNDELSHGVVLITVARYPDDYAYGDRLRVEGVVQSPHEFEDFSYSHYLRRYGITSVMYDPKVRVVEPQAKGGWRAWIFRFKTLLEARLNRLLPEPHASFAAGLLLGSRRGIPEELLEAFNASGLTHIIAISGYNITLIIVFVSGLFRFLSNGAKTVVATVIIVGFVILVGGTAAVVRAAIMGTLGLWALWFGRRSEVTRLLALTLIGMTLWNPFILIDDVGFHLSFAATCGLVYMTPYVERVLVWLRIDPFLPRVLSIREALVTTLAAQTLAVPIIILNFGRLSLVAPLANVAAVSLIPMAMGFSGLALLLSCVAFEWGMILAYLAWFFLEAIIQIAHFFAEVPWASVEF